MKLDLATLTPDVSAVVDAVDERILDAALEEIAAHGAAKATTEGIARRAHVNRATVYRRFGDRDRIIEAMTLREGQRFALGVAEAMARAETPLDQLVEGFVASLRMAAAHPVISRVARYEPGELVRAGLADDAALLRLGASFVATAVRDAQAGHSTTADPDQIGETVARLFASFVLLPPTQHIDLNDDDAARAYARLVLAPLVLGQPTTQGAAS